MQTFYFIPRYVRSFSLFSMHYYLPVLYRSEAAVKERSNKKTNTPKQKKRGEGETSEFDLILRYQAGVTDAEAAYTEVRLDSVATREIRHADTHKN